MREFKFIPEELLSEELTEEQMLDKLGHLDEFPGLMERGTVFEDPTGKKFVIAIRIMQSTN